MLIFALNLALLSATISVEDSNDRSDAYDAMLGCAAFHTIESTTTDGEAAEAQRAAAYDFAEVAATYAPDGKKETANIDLAARLAEYRQKLDTGDVREMAEDWTALESACRELYSLRKQLGQPMLEQAPTENDR